MSNPPKAGIRLAALTALLALALAELALRSVYPLADPFPNQRRIEIGAYVPHRHAPAFELRVTPEAGLPGVSGMRVFRTNVDGYVGPALSETSTVAQRVFLVGGSTTEAVVLGNEANPATLIARQLRDRVPEAVVINTGHSGDATFDHLAVLGHRVAHESPRVVVFLVGVNDLIATGRGETYDRRAPDQTVPLGFAATLRLLITQLHTGRLLFAALGKGRLKQWDESSPTIETHYRRAARRCAAQPAAKGPPTLDVLGFERNLKQLIAMTRAVGATPVLATQPHSWDTPSSEAWWWMRCFGGVRYSPAQMSEALGRLNTATREVARTSSAAVVDLAGELDGQHMYDDVHFNDAGAEALAEHLARAITDVLGP